MDTSQELLEGLAIQLLDDLRSLGYPPDARAYKEENEGENT